MRPQLDNRTLWEQVRDHLREEILSGQLKPGSQLPETELATSFGISRGPLREALGHLASEGLITITPRRGAFVTQLTREEFLDAYQVREALETLAIQLAVPQFTEEDIEELRGLVERMDEHAARGEVRAFFEANSHFHQSFIEASDNRKLQEMHRLLIGQMGRYLARSLALRGSLEASNAEHHKILAAIETRDADLAARLLAEHIEVPQRELQENVKEEFMDFAPDQEQAT